MPRKRKPPRVPSTSGLVPGLPIASQAEAERFYGPDVSGVIRVDNFPQRASSYIVQTQFADTSGLSGWESVAVYRTREAAELFAARMEQGGSQLEDVAMRTGERLPRVEQPVAEYRVVTLDDLVREGPLALARALLSLITSDHEWQISTEVGSAATIALMQEIQAGEVG